MLFDVVVDTNVFLHSADSRQPLRVASREFLNRLLAGTTCLCVDEGFDIEETKNRSVIGCEYLANLRFVMPAFAIVVGLGTRGRIVRVKRTVDRRAAKKILQLLRNKTDRVFIKVTYNSRSHTFVSHDFRDLPPKKRDHLRHTLGVRTITAEAARESV